MQRRRRFLEVRLSCFTASSPPCAHTDTFCGSAEFSLVVLRSSTSALVSHRVVRACACLRHCRLPGDFQVFRCIVESAWLAGFWSGPCRFRAFQQRHHHEQAASSTAVRLAEHLVELGTKFTRAAEVGLQLVSLDWKFGNYWLPSGRPVRDLVIKATCRSAESNPQRVSAQRTVQVTRVTRPLNRTYRLR